MSVKETMSRKLRSALSPDSMDVIDDSASHAGHLLHPGGGAPPGETHFTVKIVAAVFAGQSRLQRHRTINHILADELRDGVHALAIDARALGE